jgi:drug/metabolite transporter (DMT)-like permease
MRKTWLGVACGVGAGALWGSVFVAPKLAADFTPLQLSAGRYLAYGLIALPLLWPRRRRLAGLGGAEWRALGYLSLLGNIVYYLLLARAVQSGGVAMTSLVIGFLPVAVTLIGSRDHGAVPLRALLPSLGFGAAGIVLIGWDAIAADGASRATPLGFLCAVGALASWTAYAVLNARWLMRLEAVSAHDWSLLTGVVTGAQAVVLATAALVLGAGGHAAADWLRFAAVVGFVAVFASIVGNALWNRASRLLPLTLSGQMILFETLFALLYGFVWEGRGPTATEAAAMVCVAASVLTCVRAHRRR